MILAVRKRFFTQSGESLEQVAQKSCGYPVSGVLKTRLDRAVGSLI